MEKHVAAARVSRRVLLGGFGSSAVLLLVACGGAASPTAAPAKPAEAPKPAAAEPTKPAAVGATSPPEATKPAAAAKPTEAPKPAAEATKPAVQAGAASGSLKGQQGVLWGLQYDPHVETYNRLSKLFEEKTGAKLAVQPQPWPLETKVLAALAAGNAPDVGCIMGKVLLPLHMRKALIDATPLFQDAGVNPKTEFYPDGIQAYTYQGKLWGVPVEVGIGVGAIVMVDAGAADKAGILSKTPPGNGKDFFESYDHLWDTGKALMIKEGDTVKRWGLSSKGWDPQSYLGIVRSHGVNWWDNETKKFSINNEAGINAFKLLAETPVKMGIETELTTSQIDSMLAGKVALARGNGIARKEAEKQNYWFDAAIAPPVKGAITNSDPLFVGEAGWGFVGLAATKKKDMVTEFLGMMVTDEGQAAYTEIYGGIPAPKKKLNTLERAKKLYVPSKFKELRTIEQHDWLLKQGDRFAYYGEGFGYVQDVEKHTGTTVSEVRQGKITAEQAAPKLQGLLEQAYQQYQEDLKKL
ncbi:MAG TPA: extracellular solute-binding protein [Chloroflexota bacterium]|nr:extracellular solute-binding protein [Chloroflexota bacterium]